MIEIEPDPTRRGEFARWVLKHSGDEIKQSGANAWLVPVDFYPAVPAEALEGAYVDGFLYGGPIAPAAPSKAVEPPVTAPEAAPKTGIRTNTRKAAK